MRLLRPPPTRRSISAGAPISASTTSRAWVKPVSSVCTEDLLFNVPPRRTNNIRRRRWSPLGEKNALDTRWESRIRKDFLKIVDKVGASKLPNARELVLPCRLEINRIGSDAKPVGVKEPVRGHPVARRIAQIDAVGVVVAEFGLVADDHHRHLVEHAAAEKGVNAFEH